MPSSIKAIFSADASQSDKVMKQMADSSEATAKAMSRNFKKEIAEIDAALKKLPAESLLAKRLESRKTVLSGRLGIKDSEEMFQKPGGIGTSMIDGTLPAMNRATLGLRRYAGGYTQLLHSARATFDSLASGMPFDRVLMQQAPQVVQALMAMKLGYIALAVAAGVAVHKASKYMSELWFAAKYGSEQALARSNLFFENLATKAKKARKDAEEVKVLEIKGKSDVLSDEAKSLSLTEEKLDAEAALAKEKIKGADIEKQLKGTLTDELEIKRQMAAIDKRRIDLKLNSEIEQNKKAFQAEQAGIEAQLLEARQSVDKITDAGQLKISQLEGNLNRSKEQQRLSEEKITAEATTKSIAIDVELKKAELDFKNKNIREPIKAFSGSARANLNANQRIGAYASAGPDWNEMLTQMKQINKNTGHLKPESVKPVVTPAVSHGAPFQRGQRA